MENYDGTEICQLVCVYILSHFEAKLNKNEMQLYFSNR